MPSAWPVYNKGLLTIDGCTHATRPAGWPQLITAPNYVFVMLIILMLLENYISSPDIP